MKMNLHSHSRFSDGDLTPPNLVKEYKKRKVDVIALADHETVEGITWFLRAVERLNAMGLEIKGLPSIEISAEDDQGVEQHLLGPLIDCKSRRLAEFLAKREQAKFAQIRQMIGKLSRWGFEVKFEDVLSLAPGSICRYHVAKAIFLEKKNLPILEHFGIKTKRGFMEMFLSDGALCYVAKKKPSVQETIELIKRAGGIAVWAHPFERNRDIETVRKKAEIFKGWGLDGLEVCTSHYTEEQAFGLHRIARDLGIFETAGSDFHGGGSRKNTMEIQTFGLKLNFPPQIIE